jgi:hypothetical protein
MLIPNVVMPFSLLLKLNLSPPAHLRVNSKKNSVGKIFLLKLLSIRVLFPVMGFYAWIRTVAGKSAIKPTTQMEMFLILIP